MAGARSNSVTGKHTRDSDNSKQPSSNLVAAGALSLANLSGNQNQRLEGFSGIIGISAGAKKGGALSGIGTTNQNKKRDETKGLSGPLTLGG